MAKDDTGRQDPERIQGKGPIIKKTLDVPDRSRTATGQDFGKLLLDMSGRFADFVKEHKEIFGEPDNDTDTAGIIGQMMRESLEEISRTAAGLMDSRKIGDVFTVSDNWRKLRELLQDVMYTAPFWLEVTTEITELESFLLAELKKPEYEGRTLGQLYESGVDDHGKVIPGSELEKALTAAREAKNSTIPRANVERARKIEYPLDKPNAIIWNLLERDTQGQIEINLANPKDRRNKRIPAYYAINFEDLGTGVQITKRLLPFDKRVYIAISALFNAGNNVMTLTQIHYAMGNTGRPSTNQLKNINDSITKMTGARIFFDNQEEAAAYKNYPRFMYDGSLLPIERGTATMNGKLTEAAIHIFREPPLISFAKQRRQITTINVELLQSPVSKTDTNLQIEDYLLERIGRAKGGKNKSCKILLETLYEKAGIKEKQKKRTPDKIRRYLQHYQETDNFIKGFTISDDAVTIYY